MICLRIKYRYLLIVVIAFSVYYVKFYSNLLDHSNSSNDNENRSNEKIETNLQTSKTDETVDSLGNSVENQKPEIIDIPQEFESKSKVTGSQNAKRHFESNHDYDHENQQQSPSISSYERSNVHHYSNSLPTIESPKTVSTENEGEQKTEESKPTNPFEEANAKNPKQEGNEKSPLEVTEETSKQYTPTSEDSNPVKNDIENDDEDNKGSTTLTSSPLEYGENGDFDKDEDEEDQIRRPDTTTITTFEKEKSKLVIQPVQDSNEKSDSFDVLKKGTIENIKVTEEQESIASKAATTPLLPLLEKYPDIIEDLVTTPQKQATGGSSTPTTSLAFSEEGIKNVEYATNTTVIDEEDNDEDRNYQIQQNIRFSPSVRETVGDEKEPDKDTDDAFEVEQLLESPDADGGRNDSNATKQESFGDDSNDDESNHSDIQMLNKVTENEKNKDGIHHNTKDQVERDIKMPKNSEEYYQEKKESPLSSTRDDSNAERRIPEIGKDSIEEKLRNDVQDQGIQNDQNKDQNASLFDDQCDDNIEDDSSPYQGQPHHCLFFSEIFNACQKGKKYYPKKGINKEPKCKSQYKPICVYRESQSTKQHHLHCDIKDCMKTTLKVGIFSRRTGHFAYQKVNKTDNLKAIIETERQKYNRFAPFIFLNCKVRFPGKNKIRQMLAFPRELKPKRDNRHQLPNINIIVIDSLSRQHFYRVLSKTVKSLKAINHRSNVLTKALDFKGMQSLAPFTYVNIHALMNGTIDTTNQKGTSARRDYPIQKLFSAFKMKGYGTLLQEDSCWHDKWGSLLTGNEKLKTPVDKKELWQDIQKTVRRWGIDDLGMTHMTCESLKKYGMTSLFDTHKMLCLNGRSISSYFIDYLISYTEPEDNIPAITYTHINFGHEKTGRRIRALDDDLSQLIDRLKVKNSTVTFLMSDHGGKQSSYSINTIPGRYEVYDSLLFSIVPKYLEDKLGRGIFKDFLANQKSLVTVLDVRDTIIKLLEIDGIQPGSKHSKSLFSNSLADRKNCQEVGIRKYALCKCLSEVNLIPPEDPKYKDFLLWLGEFAVGYLNNKLSGLLDKSGTGDTARCMLIKAKKLRLVIQEQSSYGVMYTFDVQTKEQNGLSNDIFNFRISYNSKITATNDNNTLMEIQTWNRISMYQKYAHCHGGAPLDMCICTTQSRFKVHNYTDVVSAHEQFGKKVTKFSTINKVSCLFLLERHNGNVVTFEALNLCIKTVRLVFGVRTLFSWRVNQGLPVELIVRPSRLMFVATFLKWTSVREETIQPNILTLWE